MSHGLVVTIIEADLQLRLSSTEYLCGQRVCVGGGGGDGVKVVI